MFKKISLGLLALFVAALAGSQAVDLTFKVDAPFGVRETNIDTNPDLPPVWSGVQPSYNFTNGAVGSLDLRPLCNDPNGQLETITRTGAPPPTGLNDTTTPGVITGTPTVNGTTSLTYNCSDGALSANTSFNIVVSSTPPSDTTPDQFNFPGVLNAPKNTVGVVCGTITLSGTNAAAPISISTTTGSAGIQYRMNAGSWVSTSGSVPPNAVIDLRLTTVNLDETTDNVILNVGGVTDACTVTTAPATSARTDIYYTLDFEGMNPQVNPTTWAAGSTSTHNGLVIIHAGQGDRPQPNPTKDDPNGGGSHCILDSNGLDPGDDCWHVGRTNAVWALPHMALIQNGSGNNPTPLTGSMYLKGTLYILNFKTSGYTVNYCSVNGSWCGSNNGHDKPRVNIRTAKAIENLFYNEGASPNHAAYRKMQYISFDIGFENSFVEDTQSTHATIFQMGNNHGAPYNNIDMSLQGGNSNNTFIVERLRGQNQDYQGVKTDVPKELSFAGMAGKMLTMVFKINVDNCPLNNANNDDCPSDGHPYFKWMYSIQGQTKLTTIYEENNVPYGFSPFLKGPGTTGTKNQPMEFTFNIPYGGAMNGNRNPYNGVYKNGTVSLIIDNVRMGGPGSSVADVHPLRFPEPSCGTPNNPGSFPCTD